MTATPRVLVFTAPVFRVRKGRRVVLSETPAPAPPPRARPLEVERLIALAHVLQARVEAGESAADLSRALGFTRARISQLLDLTLLAPDITWPLHFMTNTVLHDWITGPSLRGVVMRRVWDEQRGAFQPGLPVCAAPDEARRQVVSLAYGNAHLENPRVTRAMVEAATQRHSTR
jgi:hypothetical protein